MTEEDQFDSSGKRIQMEHNPIKWDWIGERETKNKD